MVALVTVVTKYPVWPCAGDTCVTTMCWRRLCQCQLIRDAVYHTCLSFGRLLTFSHRHRNYPHLLAQLPFEAYFY